MRKTLLALAAVAALTAAAPAGADAVCADAGASNPLPAETGGAVSVAGVTVSPDGIGVPVVCVPIP